MSTIYALIFSSTIMLAASIIGLCIPGNNYIANSIVASVFGVILFVCILLLVIFNIRKHRNKKEK